MQRWPVSRYISSASLSTDDEKKQRLQEALDTINNGVKVAPDDSNIHAVRAFVLDWNSNPIIAGDNSKTVLTEAEQGSSASHPTG